MISHGLGVITEKVSPDDRHQAALTIVEMGESHECEHPETLEILRMLGLTDETDYEVLHEGANDE